MSLNSGCVGDGLGGPNETGAPSEAAGRPAPAHGGCASAVAEPPTCQVVDEGSGAVFSVAPGQLVLDAALEQGVDLAHGCRNGVCGACAVDLVEGAENGERADAIETNSLQRFRLSRTTRLACRLRLTGPAKLRPA